MYSRVDSGNENWAMIYHNGYKVPLTDHDTYSQWYVVQSTGGRELFLNARAEDTIYLKATKLEGEYHDIYFCAEYIPKI